MLLVAPAKLEFQDGVPFSPTYGDIYHTRSGGPEQAQQVFLAGNGLPQRWRGCRHFSILETGFGLGLNFLATWAAWQADPLACKTLHFVSIEKHPFSAEDLKTAHATWPEFAELAAELQAQWPPLLPGFHRLFLNGGKVVLTLIFDDASTELRHIEGSIDAFYLDGFSPAHNPELWTSNIAQALARVAAPNATLATWSVAGAVRATLDEAGFTVSKQPGFGRKRHMLTGTFRHRRPVRYTPPEERTALVIGAGIAGTSIAERLAARGWQVTVLEAAEKPGQKASGNVAGVIRPLPSADDNHLARLTRAGFLAARQHLQKLAIAGLPVRGNACGALHLAQDAEQEASQQRTVERLAVPAQYLQFWDAKTAQEKIGSPVPFGGWFFPWGGWVQPPTVCAANLLAHPDNIQTYFNSSVADLERNESGDWQAIDATGKVIAKAAIAIIAAGVAAPQFTPLRWLPQAAVRGQVSHLPPNALALSKPLAHLICGHGYITPEVDGCHIVGASTVHNDVDESLRPSEHLENLTRLQALLPNSLAQGQPELASLPGRVGFRPASPDRLPIVGPVPVANTETPSTARPKMEPGLWCLQGFGARGIVWSALMAELLASQINAEPLPLPGDLVRALSPVRLLNKAFPLTEKDCDNMSQV